MEVKRNLLADQDCPWLVTACWDGQSRRVRFRCRTKEDAFRWCAWCLRYEFDTNPEVVSLKCWQEFLNFEAVYAAD